MGRFSLRDEGKTIGVGKVLKYKPYTKGIVGALKSDAKKTTTAQQEILTQSAVKEDMVFDMETGEMRPKAKQMAAIQEGDEEE
jgi:hypothetical protein